ncbi:hypothetical protein KFL_000190030 [Klebsormidium nitens]|uniref:FAD dependent oxidoreductase domain-containing protein n=1 Tax=Klebsormidium nitens TaxID=105231 RepID=A0A1Y1HJQ9_KLENI|nr:hypothetical protein KFL_000190030 [Klebsormidium nitens]|eukprot:GAQ78784.1 hypothetical protein KFL_000190030 [Klebsormidium nitens]
MSHRVAVIGSGIIGLSTAVCIARSIPDVSVTVISDRPWQETTSYGAGGLWMPYSLGDAQDPELVKKWGKITHEHLERELQSRDAGKKGVFPVTGHEFFKEGPDAHPDPPWRDVVSRFAHATPRELYQFHPHEFKHGWVFSTIICEPRRYLPCLEEEILARGGGFVRKRVGDIYRDLGQAYDLVVNCTGLGARDLVGDQAIAPVQGQVLRVNAPEIKHYYGFDDTTYVIPNTDTVVLGGSTDRVAPDTVNAATDDELSRDILDRCSAYLPSLTAVDLASSSVEKWSGLRPVREAIRLELEEPPPATSDGNETAVPVVHNYGHGGSGFTLFWGCAAEAANLVRKQLNRAADG